MKPHRLLAIVALAFCVPLALGAAACGGGPVAPAGLPATRPATQPALSSEAYLAMVRDLADPSMEGRGPGTAGIEKARDYIIRHFQEAGLESAFGESYTQPFELRTGMRLERQALTILDSGGKAILEPSAGRDFAATGLSPDANFQGAAAWVGYGIRNPQEDYDSYGDANGESLQGKVAVMFRYEPQDANGQSLWVRGRGVRPWSAASELMNKARWAASQGALAAVVVNPPSQDQDKTLRGPEESGMRPGTSLPVFQITTEMFGRLRKAAGQDGSEAALRKLQQAADQGAAAPQAMGGIVVGGMVSLKARTVTVHNVGGLLRGAGALAGEVIVIGAHYDHVGLGGFGSRSGERVAHPGADDNASGTAGVMALAGWFASRAAEPNAPASRRSILFVTFSAEERGLIGSGYLVRNFSQTHFSPQQVMAMLNLDMIGRLRNDRLPVQAADSAAQWREILKEAAQGTGVEVSPSGGGISGSDQGSFYNVLRVPVLHFFTGLHADYHTPRDTADKINAPGAVHVLRVAANVAEALWSRPARLTFTTARPATAPAGPSAYLGIVPDEPAEEGKGLPVMSVMPGSPADAAGLKAGDVLLRLNDKAVNSFKDLLDALGAGKPGDKVRLGIQRQGKALLVEATLGRRG